MSSSDIWMSANGVRLDPQTVVDMTVEQIMAEKGVNLRNAYVLRRTALAEVNAEGASHSLAQAILMVLKNGHAKDVSVLREALIFKDHSASAHDIVKAVWSLQKRGLVTFYEKKSGRDSIISKIKLTPRGEVETGLRVEHDNAKPDHVRGSRELKRRSPVGKDMTDAANHHWVAKGGPVERVIPERTNGHAPLNQNERPYVAPDPFEGFPQIKAIYERKQQAAKLELAAEALLEAGEETMANEILEKIAFSDLEKEILTWLAGNGMD